jgi:hypothetical protein
MAGAIAPATVLRPYQDQPGAKAPGQRPPRPRRALLARRAGRWPAVFPDLPVCGAPSRTGGGNALRFLIPPGEEAELRRRHGRGHRPCHSAVLPLGRPGDQGPRPAPGPPLAGTGLHCACMTGLCGTLAPDRAGRGTAMRLLARRDRHAAVPKDQNDLPVRQAAAMPFQYPVRPGCASGAMAGRGRYPFFGNR